MEETLAIDETSAPAQAGRLDLLKGYKFPAIALAQLTGSVLYERIINTVLG